MSLGSHCCHASYRLSDLLFYTSPHPDTIPSIHRWFIWQGNLIIGDISCLESYSWSRACIAMEITFPNPSSARHDRNPNRGINYGLSRYQPTWSTGSRSILTPIYIGPRSLNKHLTNIEILMKSVRFMEVMDDDIRGTVFARCYIWYSPLINRLWILNEDLLGG